LKIKDQHEASTFACFSLSARDMFAIQHMAHLRKFKCEHKQVLNL